MVVFMKTIMIVEDDETISLGLECYLKQEGFKVLIFHNEECLNYLDGVHLVLLDIGLPNTNGFDLFSKIKEIDNIPIIFLTASDLESSIIKGLEMGADDYITKPFKTKELLARIKNTLKRSQSTSHIIKLGNVSLDLNQGKVFKNGINIFLTSLEYKIFVILALNPDTIFSRKKLLTDIWDVNEEYVYDNTLTVYIKRIREKIEDNPSNPKIIITVRGLGYRIGSL